MTIDQLIAQARASVAANLADRETQRAAIETVRAACLADAGRDPSDAEAAQVRAAQEAITGLDTARDVLTARVTELETEKARDDAAAKLARDFTPAAPRPKYDDVARTGQEPRTYTARASEAGEARFFQDAWNAQRGVPAARERIERHGREVEVENEMTARALNTGGIAGLTVPQYLVAMAAPVLRAGRPVANAVNRHQIPDEGMNLIVPRGTTGATVAAQATENTSVSSTDEVWANLTIPVCTVAGQAPVSRQSLERGEGVDEIIYQDLVRAHAAQVDNYVLNGSGASGQPLGLLQTAGIGAATAFGAVPGAANVTLKVAGAITNVTSAGAGLFPKVLIMHPRRWGWYTGLVDSSNRPIVVANAVGPYNAAALINPGTQGEISADPDPINGMTFVGMHSSGLPVITDLNVPSNVGTNVEDLIIAADTQELHLWEDGDGLPRQLSFEQTAGQNLTTTLVVYSYIAFTGGRYPAAVAKVGGLDSTATFGLVAPSF